MTTRSVTQKVSAKHLLNVRTYKMHSITLRLKLTEFIDTEIEEYVIDKINQIYKIGQFKLHLWYNKDEVKSSQIKTFLEKYEKLLHYKTTITPTQEVGTDIFVWFDIIPDRKYECNRARYTYEGNVLAGLNQFGKTHEFCKKPKNNDKPIRKQKRND